MRRPQDWMRQAESDRAMATAAKSQARYEWACFAAQQSAEKAVKGLHDATGVEAWGHSVGELLQALPGVPSDVLNAARALDKHYIAPRYPDAHQSGAPTDLYTELDADRALGDLEIVLRYVRDSLPPS